MYSSKLFFSIGYPESQDINAYMYGGTLTFNPNIKAVNQ